MDSACIFTADYSGDACLLPYASDIFMYGRLKSGVKMRYHRKKNEKTAGRRRVFLPWGKYDEDSQPAYP